MPSGFKIASAYVDVRLDKSQLRDDIARLPSDLNGDVDRAGTSVGKRMGQSVGKGLDGEATKAGRSAGDKVSRGIEQSINRGHYGEALKRQVDAAIKSLPQVNLLNLDVRSTAEMDRLRRELESLSSKKIGVDLSASDAEAKIALLGKQLNELGRNTPHIQLKADTAAAAAQLAAFQATAQKSGNDSGSAFSKGMANGASHGSALIKAAIAGVLAAGAPAAAAGATLLFGGIGVAAASMNDEIQKHWSATWASIVTGTKQDATILQHTVDDAATQVAQGFSALRPALRLIFADLQPLIQPFIGSLLDAAQNAMPGLVNAVHNAQPVMAGLGDLVEKIGTGLSGFFDAISQHGQAAGSVFSQLGTAVSQILPILGDLLGAGAEVASSFLPLLTGGLSALQGVIDAIGPALPGITAAIGGWQIGEVAAGWLGKAASAVGYLGDQMGGNEEGAGAFSSALSTVGDNAESISQKAGPILGAALSVLSFEFENAQQQIQQWGQALVDGGDAAEQATQQINDWVSFLDSGASGIAANVTGMTNLATAFGVGTNSMENAKGAADEILASMTPLQIAQQDVTKATNDLNEKVNQYGAESPQAAYAAGTLAQAQAEVRLQNNLAEIAIEGVTEAMVAQANQALAAASSSFAYDQATQQVADAQQHLIDVQNDGKATQSDLNNATNSLNQALLSQAEAAGRLASDALPATASEMDHNTASAQATLQELYKLRDQMGAQFPAALQTAITGLENSGAAMANTGGQASGASAQVGGLARQLIDAGIIHISPTVGLNNQASAVLAQIQTQINNIQGKTVTITTVYRQSGITAGAGMTTIRGVATGGPINDVIKAASGRVVGPGTGTSDSVPAIGPNGSRYALSNGEWIIKDAAVRALERAFGPSAMPTINSGRLPVATDAGTSGSMTKLQGGAVSVNELHLHFEGTWDLTNPQQLRSVGSKIRDVLITLDREQR